MLKITKSGLVFSGSEQDIEQARAEFEQKDWIRLSAILDPELWSMLQEQLAGINLEAKTPSIYRDLNVSDSAILVLLNNERLFKLIEHITGCGHIGCFRGRTYRIIPGANHHDDSHHYHEILTDWHTDLNGTRRVALSINLSTEPFQGGVFKLREAKTGRMLCELTNSGFGNAILFRIDERLEHHVSDVEGTVTKTAFSGWFESEPDYRTLLAEGIARSLRKTPVRRS